MDSRAMTAARKRGEVEWGSMLKSLKLGVFARVIY